eukprot:TRINITY_DN8021_c0_g2_i1.p1 TRINITY_DN8021_c0_g2~~TRINITY_DN8021_c0_g2_i1.p1  ORF type:complete len:196 (+),score=30.29 TRINITY_DN8021_c0_g2_i1:121-708(+)
MMNSSKRIKVVLLGDSGVGKTSILNQLATGKFHSNTQSTRGVDCVYWDMKLPELTQTFTLQIWDTAGQEKYHSMSATYYQQAAAAVVVYDVTRKSSFTGAKSWLKEMKERGYEDIKLLLVGNKPDCILDDGVKLEEAKDYADSINVELIIASAKENINIAEIFKQVVRLVKVSGAYCERHNVLRRNGTGHKAGCC